MTLPRHQTYKYCPFSFSLNETLNLLNFTGFRSYYPRWNQRLIIRIWGTGTGTESMTRLWLQRRRTGSRFWMISWKLRKISSNARQSLSSIICESSSSLKYISRFVYGTEILRKTYLLPLKYDDVKRYVREKWPMKRMIIYAPATEENQSSWPIHDQKNLDEEIKVNSNQTLENMLDFRE